MDQKAIRGTIRRIKTKTESTGTFSLRSWLNDDFLNAAFTEEEQNRIRKVTIDNPDNPVYGTVGGEAKEDRIFVLSADEVIKYYGLKDLAGWNGEKQYGFSRELLVQPTEYALRSRSVANGVVTQQDYDDWFGKESGYGSEVIGTGGAYWWLRSPGDNNESACQISYFTCAGWDNYWLVDAMNCGVRPALYLSQ